MDERVGISRWSMMVLAIVAVTGLAAIAVAERQAEDDASARQRALTTEASMLVESTGRASVTALAGAGGLVSETGTVDLDSFGTFADEVAAASPIQALGLEPVTPLEDRPELEAAIGGQILDQRDGELVPAGERPLYYPVRAIEPATPTNQASVGLDILADPARGTAAIAARDTGKAVLTGPVPAAPSGAISYFLVKPLYRPGQGLDSVAARRRAHVGFISTVYLGRSFAELLVDTLPHGSRFSLRDGGVELAGSSSPPRGGATRTVTVGDRRWSLVVEDGRRTDRGVVFAVAAFGALLVGGLLLFFRRSALHDADVERAAAVIASTADFAQRLAAAASVQEVEQIIRQHLAPVVGAATASLGIVDADRGVLSLNPSATIDGGITERWREIPLDAREPITEVVRTGTPLILHTLDDWRDHATPDAVADAGRAGIVSAACLPLADRHGRVGATIAVSWAEEIAVSATTTDTLRTLTELCEQSLARARATDVEKRAAQQLAQLAARLASASTVAEVLDTITTAARSP
ncbi:MAG: CHASE domain-containing protein, partial [Acidimicrobiales bacterium]